MTVASEQGVGVERKPRFRFNEWKLTLALLVVSLSFVLAKLAIYFGMNLNPMSHFGSQNYYQNTNKLMGSALNASGHYENLINSRAAIFVEEHYWFLNAFLSGVATTAFSWFIVYKDSQVPGVNPPSPFSPRRKAHYPVYEADSFIQMNYLFGLLVGLFVFVYKCF